LAAAHPAAVVANPDAASSPRQYSAAVHPANARGCETCACDGLDTPPRRL